jgi:SAM-dependent methyltransferase
MFTEDQVRDYLATFPVFRQPEQQGYLATAVDRFTRTLNHIPLLRNTHGVRVLEIGGRPYFFSALLRHFFGYEIYLANEPTTFPGDDGDTITLTNDDGETIEFPQRRFNIEYDAWPWPDDYFDIVVYGEVIEHLVYDPTHTLVECHRVLVKDTGTLVLSTPNGLSYTLLVQMIRGFNPFPPYSGHSHYARHHRLFSLAELRYLCERIGFTVDDGYTAYDTAYWHPPRLNRFVRALVRTGRLRARLDVIYLVATPKGTASYAYPSRPFLIYQDAFAYNRVVSNRLAMSDDIPQLGEGFHNVEQWGDNCVRWTAQQARLFLKRCDETTLELTFFSGSHRDATVTGWVDITGADALRHRFTVPGESWETLTLPLPDGDDEVLNIHLGVDTTFVPAEVPGAGTDTRQLGIALREAVLV